MANITSLLLMLLLLLLGGIAILLTMVTTTKTTVDFSSSSKDLISMDLMIISSSSYLIETEKRFSNHNKGNDDSDDDSYDDSDDASTSTKKDEEKKAKTPFLLSKGANPFKDEDKDNNGDDDDDENDDSYHHHHYRGEGRIFHSLWKKWIVEEEDSNKTKKQKRISVSSRNIMNDDNNNNDDDNNNDNKGNKNFIRMNYQKEEQDNNRNNHKGGSRQRLRISSSSMSKYNILDGSSSDETTYPRSGGGTATTTMPTTSTTSTSNSISSLVLSSLKLIKNKNLPPPRIIDTNNYQNDYHYQNINNNINQPPASTNRLLQINPLSTSKSTSSSKSLICSNISDTFQTFYAIFYSGNTSLITEEKANLLAITFATSYNDGTSSTTTTNKCDPLFRTITQIQVTTNSSFTGTNNGELVENPIPLIPVRKMRTKKKKRKRKLQQQQQQQDDDLDDHFSLSSSLMDDEMMSSSWESVLELHRIDMKAIYDDNDDGDSSSNTYKNIMNRNELHHRLLQQQISNRTVASYDVGLILMEIFGSCRGCQGNSIEFDLFDDTSSRRYLEEEEEEGTTGRNDDDDCICPADTETVDLNDFQSSFTENIEVLVDNDELDFLEELDEIIPIREATCPTNEQDFSTVYIGRNLIFNRDLLFRLGVGAEEIQRLFKNSYNGVAQQLCDALYRAISTVQLVSIEQEEGTMGNTVQFEFVIEATCRGDNCIDVGCIFEDKDSCDGDSNNEQRRRKLETTNKVSQQHLSRQHPISASKNDIAPVNSITTATATATTTNVIKPPRLLKDDEDEGGRCFCRKGRSIRPPTPSEVRLAFQAGLDRITEKNKLPSCQECSFSTDCQTGVCSSAGRCAEADTQLLLNSCICGNNDECESGFCQQEQQQQEEVASSISGTCQGKLASCRVCNNGDECLSGFCTGGRCAEPSDGKLKTGCECNSNLDCQSGRCVDDLSSIGVSGKCMGKIEDTCTEPCLSSIDCESGLCGSLVCMPFNGTLLAEGCLSTLATTECESGVSENSICTERTSLPPSFQPSQEPTFQPSSRPSKPPSAGPSTNPSQGPTTRPSGEPSKEPTTNPSMEPSFYPSQGPTAGPSGEPSKEPTTNPSMEPSSNPSQVPTPGPTVDPSTSPTLSPSLFPSSGPTCSEPSCPAFACDGFGVSATRAACGSCLGENSCRSFANGSIGANSCVTPWDCFESTGLIGEGSCDGKEGMPIFKGNACRNLKNVNIGNGACLGPGACACLEPGSTVLDGECTEVGECCDEFGGPLEKGLNSCTPTFGAYTEICTSATGPIGIDSCQNGLACTASNAAIGDGSCIGEYSCQYFAWSFLEPPPKGSIDDNACVGFSACWHTGGSIKSLSCHGCRACEFSTNAEIGSGSCLGGASCRSKSNLKVGDNSCTCPWCCHCLADGAQVADNSCNQVGDNYSFENNVQSNVCCPIPTEIDEGYSGYCGEYVIPSTLPSTMPTTSSPTTNPSLSPTLTSRPTSSPSTMPTTSFSPSFSPTFSPEFETVVSELGNLVTSSDLNDSDSISYRAVDWLATNIDSNPDISIKEQYATIVLYLSNGGENWNRRGDWMSSTVSMCAWENIDCITNTIDLSSNNLVGTIPSTIGLLTSLNFLYLYTNALTGPVPTELGQLINLQELNLVTNALTGPIPTELGQLINLLTLSLRNQLTGQIPTELGQLINLGTLDIRSNALTGPIPTELGQLINLRRLDLRSNALTGVIPPELGQMINLRYLYLNGNLLYGPIPTEFGQLSYIRYLYLVTNALTGVIPTELGQLNQVEVLDLGDNSFDAPQDISPIFCDPAGSDLFCPGIGISVNSDLTCTCDCCV